MAKKKTEDKEVIQDAPLSEEGLPLEPSLPTDELDFGQLVSMNLGHEVSVRVLSKKDGGGSIIAVGGTSNCIQNPGLIIGTLCEGIGFIFSQLKDILEKDAFNEEVKRVIDHIAKATIDTRKPGSFIFKEEGNE